MATEYESFRKIITGIINSESEKAFKKNNTFTAFYGEVTAISKSSTKNVLYLEDGVVKEKQEIDPFSQTCNVNLFFTEMYELINKSGEVLQKGDSVTVLIQDGSNFGNAFVFLRNGLRKEGENN